VPQHVLDGSYPFDLYLGQLLLAQALDGLVQSLAAFG
jgi:hypothetical protein